MKEKTFKDLGLDEGDKYLHKLGEEYDLGDLLKEEEDNKLLQKKKKDINDKV